jgi:hypothetical protein
MTTNKTDGVKSAGKKILERIKKLLRMADDVGSPNEAAIAARRAERMMAEYNLSHADLVTSGLTLDAFIEAYHGDAKRMFPRWQSSLAVTIAGYTDCRVRFGRKPGTVLKQLVYQGEEKDLAICTYLHTYLMRTVNRLCKESGVLNIGPRNSFRMACAGEIANTLNRMKREDAATDVVTSDGKSLVLVNRKAALLAEKFGVVKYGNRSYGVSDGGAHAAGTEAGRGVSIRKAVNSGNKTRRLK